MYRRATGYTRTIETIKTGEDGKESREVKVMDHLPPDVNAAKFWLMNRRKEEWKERLSKEVSGPDGGPVPLNIGLQEALAGIVAELKGKK